MSQAIAANTGARVSLVADVLPLVGGVMLSAIFLLSGIGKLTMPSQVIAHIAATGAPFATLGFGLSVAVELGCGLALLLGYRARPAAVVLTVYCFATALMFHRNFADQGQLVNFLKNVAMAGGLLQVVAYGRGRLSLDARRR